MRALFTVSNRFPSGNELGKRIFALNPGFPSSFSRRITVFMRYLTTVASLCMVFLLRFLAPVAVYFVSASRRAIWALHTFSERCVQLVISNSIFDK